MTKNELGKIYDMLNSHDKEMIRLALTIIKNYNPELDLSKLTYYNWSSDIEAEFCRIIYRACHDSNKRQRIIKAVRELKDEAVKAQQYLKAAFFRDIEKYGYKQIEEHEKK